MLVVKTTADPAEYLDSTKEGIDRIRAVAEKYPYERLLYHIRMLDDALVQRIKKRVYDDGMGFVAMHSAHMSKPFREIVGTSGKLLWSDDKE